MEEKRASPQGKTYSIMYIYIDDFKLSAHICTRHNSLVRRVSRPFLIGQDFLSNFRN